MRGLVLVLVLASCATAPPPASITAPGPAIVRDAPAGPEVEAAAYIRLVNGSDTADRLLTLSCDCAERVEIHETVNRVMHTLPHLDIPARGEVEIVPGGPTHMMLIGVRDPIEPGDRVTMTLSFEHAPPLTAEFIAVENSREGWAAHDPLAH
jgi:copper(I)-binding protein